MMKHRHTFSTITVTIRSELDRSTALVIQTDKMGEKLAQVLRKKLAIMLY